MICAADARKEQFQNSDTVVSEHISKIDKQIRTAIRSVCGETSISYWVNGETIASLISEELSRVGYNVDVERSNDPRDGNLMQLKIEW
ncbi:hypothetical protein Aeh1ORF297c [Aeromonas phage Aeh1]|uniref:Uncharacterized protein n=1 Tax=Aeromonas phage Aeh1 TaxID=2880362 RepID=Q76YC9_9CAUD|nr:hypothetical protein Aeh1p316 [Aeromonas phage Aeh1]AAQ17966.1 hypothetical protein Aeh1ORF297c [Aeromonas phage Aeh1]